MSLSGARTNMAATASSVAMPTEPVSGLVTERAAMILGMNPSPLRKRRPWRAFLWPRKRHWALVLQPSGEAFCARITDDFVHGARHCFNTEVPSSQFFIVYELLVAGDLFISLSVKPDFQATDDCISALGIVGPACFEELQQHALGVIQRYRCYNLVGCNCQHFASDLALSLGAPKQLLPDDEATALAQCATDGAAAIGATGAAVAAGSALGAAVFAAAPPTSATLALTPVVLSTVAVTATAVGLIGGSLLVGVAGTYQILHKSLRVNTDPLNGLKASSTVDTPCFEGSSKSSVIEAGEEEVVYGDKQE